MREASHEGRWVVSDGSSYIYFFNLLFLYLKESPNIDKDIVLFISAQEANDDSVWGRGVI